MLQCEGHDVLPLSSDPARRRWDDAEILELAAAEGRIVVTCDADDFPRIHSEWLEERRSHAGCLVLVRIDHSEFGLILRALRLAFERWPAAADWRDQLRFVGRGA